LLIYWVGRQSGDIRTALRSNKKKYNCWQLEEGLANAEVTRRRGC